MTKNTVNAILVSAAMLALLAACAANGPAHNGPGDSSLHFATHSGETSIETQHPYLNYTNKTWSITGPDEALSMTILFDRFDSEQGYDYVSLYDRYGTAIHRVSGQHSGESFTVEGSKIQIRFESDYSITAWGFSVTSYTYETAEADDPSHRPVCDAIGSRSEGWYWADTGERIRFESCAGLDEPQCGAIGSRSEGWYSNGEPALIAWDNCHRKVRIAIEQEPCGPSIGFSCYDNLYCHGLPGPGIIGGSGTCKRGGYCEVVEDCEADGNDWLRPMCVGHATCDAGANTCGWICDPVNTGPWSWTTVLLRGIESAHPYADNFDDTWMVGRPGADRIKVHFMRIETENNYDFITIYGDREERAMGLDGTYQDYWTPEFGGDTLHINLRSDYSITRWGFRADSVRYYERLPVGMCNRDEDCNDNEECNPHMCFNPYAPCYGDCRLREDGGGGEGDACSGSSCAGGLFCKNVVEGEGACRGELWCDEETAEKDCERVAHIMVPGFWTCRGSMCAWETDLPEPLEQTFASDTAMEIPDNSPAGITSLITVDGFDACTPEISVNVTIRHTYRGDLVVGLTDPDGSRFALHTREGGDADDLVLESYALTGLLGRDGVAGAWTLDVSDHASWDVGTLEAWSIHVSCP